MAGILSSWIADGSCHFTCIAGNQHISVKREWPDCHRVCDMIHIL